MTEQIKGREILLGGGRKVFASEQGDRFYIEFTSREGSTTRLCLSHEACDALSVLTHCSKSKAYEQVASSRPKQEDARWQVVPGVEA